MARLTVELCAAKLLELSGNVAAVARTFDVKRSSVYSFMDDHPELKEVLREARETMKDNVESRLYADCLKDDPAYQTSRIFFLKTQAKDRGYIERQETEVFGAGGGPVLSEIEIVYHNPAAISNAPGGAGAEVAGAIEGAAELPSGPVAGLEE